MRTIWWCLMQVPVRHWWQLFHNLRRLEATYELARSLGRTWMRWHLREDGMIFVSAWDETEAERRAKCALPDGFDRAPWRRLETRIDPDYLARHSASLAEGLALAALLSCGTVGLAFAGNAGGASATSHLPFLAGLTYPAAPLFHPP
ncbi:MAG: hypothetical protein RLN72_16005 [Henriciella sp.]